MTQSVKNLPSRQETACNTRDPSSIPVLGSSPWSREWQLTPVFLPGKCHGRGAWWATVHGASKRRPRLSGWAHTAHVNLRLPACPSPTPFLSKVYFLCLWVCFSFVNNFICVVFRFHRQVVYDKVCLFWLPSLSMITPRSIHVAANGIVSFFSMAEQYSILYMHHIFIHSSINQWTFRLLPCLGCWK